MALSSETVKRTYLVCLTIGTGGALFFLALAVASALHEQFFVSQGVPIPATPVRVSVSTVEGVLFAVVLFLSTLVLAFMLRRNYKQHPGGPRGPLHLPLADLLVVAIACGLAMAAMCFLWGQSGQLACAIVTIFYGLLLALGFMVANAYRIPSGWRVVFAFALPFAVHGALSIGALIAGVLCISILGQSGWLFLDFILTILPDAVTNQQYPIMARVCGSLRAGICVAPFALFLYWVAWCQRLQSDTETTQNPHRKALTAQEALGGVGLALSLGGLALCIASHFSYSFYYRPTAWGFALSTAGIVIGSGWLLLHAFGEARRQGYTPRVGFRRLLFAFLLFVSLNVGMHLLGMRLFGNPDDDPLTVLLGHVVTLAAGLILAGRPSWNRLALAFGFMPLTFGALATGALTLRFIEATWQSGFGIALADTGDVLSEIRGYYFLLWWPSEGFLSWVLRYGLYMLPIGVLLCWLVKRPSANRV